MSENTERKDELVKEIEKLIGEYERLTNTEIKKIGVIRRKNRSDSGTEQVTIQALIYT